MCALDVKFYVQYNNTKKHQNYFERSEFMTLTNANIKVPDGMIKYLNPKNEHTELVRNALLLYPYIDDKTISHGKAAEILGIPKYELIEIYDNIGLPYLSMDIEEVEEEIENWDKLKGAFA
jgi:hypothetical protein